MAGLFVFLGRLFLSAIFLMSGINKAMDPTTTQAYMAAKGMPLTGPLIAAAIFLEVLGGLMVLTGLKARTGAVLLIIFMIPTTVIFHTDFSQQTELIHFLKNLSILGGLCLVAYFGAGPWSFDARKSAAD